ncbi:hypothetical protein Avbf_09083 [Armadillidium vulgare]|nr:hypothetical protein Avbf_09083 [Armadillidium vulgare]
MKRREWMRTADVRSVGYSELFSLSREDVLAAMKDYPEAQKTKIQVLKNTSLHLKIECMIENRISIIEILQSLGHKRLKEARHQNCRPEIITPSSKILSSPIKGDGKDEKQPKKLVSRIRSDVSAIRNAFRKSRAMTKENETVELEPLNDDGKEFHENENETPSVKKILRRLGRTVGSGGSDGSFKISRGILKRMSHVTSDEINSQNQNKTIVEDQGVLGAGLPLLQRLKLLKEKEEREERGKRIPDSDSKSKRSLSQKRLKEFSMSLSHESTKDEISKSEEEPEVIGAGLPLFARLRLLKVKEEKEKMQSQTQGSKIKGSSIDSVHSSDRSSECSVLLPKKIEKSLSVDSRSSSSDSKTKDSTEKSTSVFKSKLKSVINQTKDPPSICVVSPSRKEDSKEEDAKINDLNKGTNMSGKLSPQSSSNGQIESNTVENQQSSRDSSSSDPSFSKPVNIKLNVQETNQMSNSNVGETHSPISPTSLSVDDTSRDKIQRSESFRKAMDSDLIEESEEGEHNIQDLSSKDENSVEKKTNFPKAKIDSSPEDNNSKAANSSLRVPSNEISPPLSSPESTETPERKNLKSILKRISRDDSTCNLLPQGSADLRRLMKAQTVQGFMARRSKLSKAVSFQRKTLSSPPSTIFDILNTNSKSKFRARSFDVSNGSRINTNSLPSLIYHQDQVLSPDGVQKVLSKLTSFGVESPCHSEDLVRGVESILRDKIEDVEVAWEARIAALKQEVAIRDETIRILSETIKCFQESSDEIILNRINLEDKTLNDVEIINSKTIDDMDSKRVRTPCLLVQISESSNPSSDEDEPLFMRCNSIESIIHQTPDVSPEGDISIGSQNSRKRKETSNSKTNDSLL